MDSNIYNILIDSIKIGTTKFEYGDPTMGVVFGKLNFIGIESGYEFLKNYCIKKQIEFTDYIDDRSISTRGISNLKIFDSYNNEIKGIASSISGMDSDNFEITLEGIPFPFYGEEFPEHIK